jgi:23S rRNA pseudouridine1911/1915/1917 synthase
MVTRTADCTGGARPTPPEDCDGDLDLDGEGLAVAPAAASGPQTCSLLVSLDHAGERLDRYLAAQVAGVSRTRLQAWITQGAVRLNGAPARAREALAPGDRIEFEVPEAGRATDQPQAMALDLVWQDESLLVLDKPAGLVVHPGAGQPDGTLLNGLLAFDPALAQLPRAGIVHRLDAGTSGLLVVARTEQARHDLIAQLQARSVHREYWAVVNGQPPPLSLLDGALARDPRQPQRFRVSRSVQAREARTLVRTLHAGRLEGTAAAASWVACRLQTGRTHQIRVHLENEGHPLLGDPVYRRHLPSTLNDCGIARQALHACRLGLVHPRSGRTMVWTRPPPADLAGLLARMGVEEGQMARLLEEGAPWPSGPRE